MKKLLRSRRNNVISGVCGGIAEYFGIDAVIVRIIWVAAAFVTAGTAIIAYIIAAIVIPETDGWNTNKTDQQQDRTEFYKEWNRYNQTYQRTNSQQQGNGQNKQENEQYKQTDDQWAEPKFEEKHGNMYNDYSDINSGMDDWKQPVKHDSDKSKRIIGIILIALGALAFTKEVLNWFDMRVIIPVALCAIGALIIFKGRRGSV